MMENNKELIHRALLGDQEAQKQCTEKGIVLPCQVCGAELEKNKVLISDGKTDMYRWTTVYQHPKNTNCVVDSIWFETNKLSLWNTRTALPIGKCGECKHQFTGDSDICHSGMDNEFCSGFEPREE